MCYQERVNQYCYRPLLTLSLPCFVTGGYMLSGKGQSVLLSPVINPLTASCLVLHYHMRGTKTGRFKVLHVHTFFCHIKFFFIIPN